MVAQVIPSPEPPSPSLRDLSGDNLRDVVVQTFGIDEAGLVLAYAEHRRPPGMDRDECLRDLVARAREGHDAAENVKTLVRMTPDQLVRSRALVAEINDLLRPMAGHSVDDPMTLREIRKVIRRHLERVCKFARPIVIADLVQRHVRFDEKRLVIETASILTPLWRLGLLA